MAKISSLIKGWLNPALSPEQQMLAYCQQPDAARLKPLVERYSDDLYHFLIAQSDVAVAEDILQHTWLKVIEKHQSFKQGSNVKSWLFTIARNTLIDDLRRNQRWDFSDIDDAIAAQDSNAERYNPDSFNQSSLSHLSTEQLVSDSEQQGISETSFQLLIQALPMAQRESVILQLEGFSIQDIAMITSEKTETVKSRLRYAKLALKKHLGTNNEAVGKEEMLVSGKEYQS
ncbi:sigma-70 family RNA polymerase sigma factor [Thalassotalea litorea]|uniref:Sigma-70 family RNA polymerase sigma factor n=1 Tax=Thalassotalea litorea TaxID=2020715 RepID=A0A5R9ILK3_9GAMM|nr:sigma-70 family RNA polymerase sigma factor [Thalassotalea litorea]TLU64086.1 sigma-70 family RNA polymerase sigma factor [Thalassotalea litorea]